MPATILHPTDFSDNSEYAFRTACSLAAQRQARLILLHVVPPATAPLIGEPPPNPLVAAEAQESCRGRFAWPKPPDAGIQIEGRVAEGDPPNEILRPAQTLDCELIVMGTHGRAGLSWFLMGSVAEEVLRKAHCPVLIVKPPFPETAKAQAGPQPGQMIDVRPVATGRAAGARSTTLFKSDAVQLVLLVVPAGKEIAEHNTKGETIVHCLDGSIALDAFGKTQMLEAGHLVHLPAGEPHRLKGTADALLLLTILVPNGS
jgi:nucleotide-binding universal stress UspA family protein